MTFGSAQNNTATGIRTRTVKKIVPVLLLASVVIGIFSPLSVNFTPHSSEFGLISVKSSFAQDVTATGGNESYKSLINALNGGGGNTSGCSLIQPSTWVTACFLRPIGNFLLNLFSLFTAIGGLILDAGMWCTVNMGAILAGVPIVDTGWKVFRDLSNMLFIFILVYIAISTILGLGETKRMLVNIVVTALLINFSLFITKAVVDTSNLFALQFYDRIHAAATQITGGSATGNWNMGGVSSLFMQGLQLQTVYNDPTVASTFTSNSMTDSMTNSMVGNAEVFKDSGKFLVMVFFGCVVMLIAGFMFAAGGILLLIRVVVLMFLMMISPLAFMCRILPSLNAGWKKWLDALINNAIWAPAYLALSYVTAVTAQAGFTNVTGLTTPGQAQSFSAVFSGALTSGMGLIINYILLIIMIIMTILLSKQFGVYGAQAVVGWGERAASSTRRWASDRARWGAGWAFSKTVGEAARRYEERAISEPGRQGKIQSRIFRPLITKPLAEKKWGGAISAVERYRNEKDRLDRLKDAQTITNMRNTGLELKALKEIAPVIGKVDEHKDKLRELEEKLQNQMMMLSPSAAAKIPTKDFEASHLLAKYLSSASYEAVMRSDKTEEEKNRITGYRNEHIYQPFFKYRDADARAKAILQNNPALMKAWKENDGLKLLEKDDSKLSVREARLKERLVKAGVKWTKEDQEAFEPAYDEVRGRSVKELGYMNRANPEAINKIAPSLNWWQVKGMRSSEDFTYAQREGKGNSLRDYKEANALDAVDTIFGVSLVDKNGTPRSIEDRFKERDKINRVWQKVNEYGEDMIDDTSKFTANERAIWTNLKKRVQENQAAVQMGIDMLQEHLKGRSPDELANPGGRVRNIPIIASFYGGNVVKPMMPKDNIHHEILTKQMLREYADDKLTEANKQFLSKIMFDRDGRDFYSEWEAMAKKMGLDRNPLTQERIGLLKQWVNEGAEGQKKFNATITTHSPIEIMPGYTPPPPGTPPEGDNYEI